VLVVVAVLLPQNQKRSHRKLQRVQLAPPTNQKRIAMQNSVETNAPPLSPGDVKNGQAMVFTSCNGNDVQKWQLDSTGSFSVRGTDEAIASDGYKHGGECLDVDMTSLVPKLQVWSCAHSPNQAWSAVALPSGGSQVVNQGTGQCMTAVRTSGIAVGLDKGVMVTAAQHFPCIAGGAPNQTFHLSNYDGQGFPENFAVRMAGELCLQPQIVRTPHFDSVAFITPDKHISVVAINLGEEPVEFTLYDEQLGIGVDNVRLPAHAIHSYRWTTHANSEENIGLGEARVSAISAAAVGAQTAMLVDDELLLLGDIKQRPTKSRPGELRPSDTMFTEPRSNEASPAVSPVNAIALTALFVAVAATLILRNTLTRGVHTSLVNEREMPLREPLRTADHLDYHSFGESRPLASD